MSEGANIAVFDNSRRSSQGKKDQSQSKSKQGDYPPGTIPIPLTDRYVHRLTASGLLSSGAGLVLLAATALGGGGTEKVHAKDYDVRPIPQSSDNVGQGEAKNSPIREFHITDKDVENVMKMVPDKLKENAQIAIPEIARALKKVGGDLDTKEALAYALATVEHESWFDTMEEIDGDAQADKYGYDGGGEYKGRGYVMLTGKPNYEAVGEYLGIDLVGNPDLLLDPKISADALAAFFDLNDLVKYTKKSDFLHARKIVNPGEFGMDEEPFKSTPFKVEQRAYDYLGSME